MKFRVHALLETLSPLHIAAPGGVRFNLSKGLVDNDASGMPCTGIQRLSIAAAEGEYIDPRGLPVIAANNIAGRLRRHGARQVLDAIQAKGGKVSLPTYSILMCGAATGNPDASDITYDEYLKVREHPYLGLFGGGPKMLRRNVRVHNALPICKAVERLMGNLRHPLASEHIQPSIGLTQGWAFRRVDDLQALSNIQLAEATIEDFREAFEARQKEIIAVKAAKGEDSPRVSTKAYSALEFVIPGVKFDLLFELDVNDAQMGLFLAALDSFCATERLGGYVRNGFGMFELRNVQLLDEFGLAISIFNNGRLGRDIEQVKGYLVAWANAAAAISVQDLEEIVKMPEPKETGKKGKKNAA